MKKSNVKADLDVRSSSSSMIFGDPELFKVRCGKTNGWLFEAERVPRLGNRASRCG